MSPASDWIWASLALLTAATAENNGKTSLKHSWAKDYDIVGDRERRPKNNDLPRALLSVPNQNRPRQFR